MPDQSPTPSAPPGWQRPSLQGLAALCIESAPAFEILTLDGIASFVFGGTLEPPYTIEHGSRIASAVLSAAAESTRYQPDQTPPITPAIEQARNEVQAGAHDFAALGVRGLTQVVNRIVSAAVGELEIHKEDPEAQVRSLFYFGVLALASGPGNTCSELASAGIGEVFIGWDDLIGAGFVPPWRLVGVT